MRLKVIGSSSAGNCYLIENDEEAIMLEAGLPIKQIKKEISDTRKVKGCFITHRHMDHKASARQVSELGIQVYANQDVIDSSDIIMPVEAIHGQTYNAGGFKVMPFSVIHNVESLNFLVHHYEMGTLAFITDTANIPYRFKAVNHFVIEANYSIKQMVANGTNEQYGRRVVKDHMSIETACNIVSQYENVKTVTLIHLSDTNSHSSEFKDMMERKTGVITTIADKKIKVDLR